MFDYIFLYKHIKNKKKLHKMTLSCYRISFLAPYFIEMQRKSFLNLLNTGLIHELSKRSPISDLQKQFKLIFYPNYYQLISPEYSAKQAILKAKTYSSKLCVPLQYIHYKTKKSHFQWVTIGNLPLMTKRGHFIVNGSPRVIVNQLVRGPGIYYRQTIDQQKRKLYYADLISNRGAWLRIEIDRKKRMRVRMKKTPKIPLLVFFQSVGITEYQLSQSIKYSEFLDISKFEDGDFLKTVEHALFDLYRILYPIIPPESMILVDPDKKKLTRNEKINVARKFLFRKFFNYRTYDLSILGRAQLNKRFHFNVSPSIHVLTHKDLLVVTDYLIKLEYGENTIDDIDHLKNRRVRTSGELIQNQLGTGLIRLEKFIRRKIENPSSPILSIISTTPVNGALREFFGSSPLSQFMDQTNPLAELTHKRRVSSLGPGGVTRETANMVVRGIHETHYGRVCPIETPEGPNAGLVNSLTVFARINNQGFLETPFYSVIQGQVQKSCGVSFISAAQEDYIISAPGDLKIDYFYSLPYTNIPVRAQGEFTKTSKNEVQYVAASPVQMISVATSLIPFLEHNDANRALMGSNMQRQAVPLLLPEKTIVGTGLEARVISDSGHGIQAAKSGLVSYVSGEIIKIENFYGISNTRIPQFTGNTFSPFFTKQKNTFNLEYFSSLNNAETLVNFKNHKQFKTNLFSKQKYRFFENKQIHTKIPTRNFLCLSELLFHQKVFLFKKRFLNNAWLGFKTIKKASEKQYSFVFAPYFIREKKFICSTLKQNVKKQKLNYSNIHTFFLPQTSVSLPFQTLFKREKNKFNCKLVKKNTIFLKPFGSVSMHFKHQQNKNEILLQNYKDTKFFKFKNTPTNVHQAQTTKASLNRMKANTEKKVNNISFFSTNKAMSREKYTSKIHLLALSDKTLRNHFDVSEDIRQKYVSYNQTILTACTSLLFAQTSSKKTNLKNIFFYKYIFWKNFFSKKCSRIKSNIKPCAFVNKYPYISTTISTFPNGSSFKKFNDILDSNRKSRLDALNIYKNTFSFCQSSFNFQKIKNFTTFSKSKTIFQSSLVFRKKTKSVFFPSQKTFAHFSTSLLTKKSHKKPFSEKKEFFQTKSFFGNKKTMSFYEQGEKFQEVKKANKLYFLGKNNQSKKKAYWSTKNLNFLSCDTFKLGSFFLHENRNYFLQSYQGSNQKTCMHQRPIVTEGEWVQEGDLLADGAASVGGELALGKTLLVAYMPWEGYNFEDAILISERLISDDLYTSIHIERYETEISYTEHGLEEITSEIPDTSEIPEIFAFKKRHLDTNGVVKLGSWVHEGDILVGKVTPIEPKPFSGYENLLNDVYGIRLRPLDADDTSLRVPKNVYGRVVHLELLEAENIPFEVSLQKPQRVRIYIAEKKKIKIGDKMSGRHGNKGIISKIVPPQDMPYLPDGSSVDMVLNPLGVPSRMNVGQIFESLLGLAGKQLHEEFQIGFFDEKNGLEASRSLTYSKLFEARLKTGKKWLFNPHYPGKIKLFDGRTGECFDQTVTVGQSYMLKLVHLVDDKIHARSTGPYSLVTQQPLRGRSKHGGQRLGEMEVWALEGFGAAYTLQEVLTSKSDDIKGRHQVMQSILGNKSITVGIPESFKVLFSELQSLCLNIGVYSITNKGRREQMDSMQLP